MLGAPGEGLRGTVRPCPDPVLRSARRRMWPEGARKPLVGLTVDGNLPVQRPVGQPLLPFLSALLDTKRVRNRR